MSYRNWAIINKKRKDRWNNMDEKGKLHMLEEKEIGRRGKILEEIIDKSGPEYVLKLNDMSFASESLTKVIEWGLDVRWGIKIELKKYPGVRFNKLDGCAAIIDKDAPRVQVKIGTISKEEAQKINTVNQAIEIIRQTNPELGALIDAVVKKETK